MAVQDVWGRIGGIDVLPQMNEGDVWWLPIPDEFREGDVTVELWARDDHGNTAYKATVVTLKGGSVKCIRHLNEHGIGLMVPVDRPAFRDATSRGDMVMVAPHRPTALMVDSRLTITAVSHHCPLMTEV